MSVQVAGSTTANLLAIDANGTPQVSVRSMSIGSNGAYRCCAVSGLLTGIAAGTATAGHLFAFRWSHSTKRCVLNRFTVKLRTITGFTAAQELGFDIYRMTGYSVAHSGGTAMTLTGENLRKYGTQNTTQMADIRIGNTGALTAGTQTLDAVPWGYECYADLAAAATVPKGQCRFDWSMDAVNDHPLVFIQNTGLVVRNTILMGAGGTARMIVEMDWLEVDSYQ